MRKLDPIWIERRSHIERLIRVEQLSDATLAERFGIGRTMFGNIRKALGIESVRARTAPEAVAPAPIHQATAYIDAEGNRVTVCPPGYADGFDMRRYTAKPRGSR